MIKQILLITSIVCSFGRHLKGEKVPNLIKNPIVNVPIEALPANFTW